MRALLNLRAPHLVVGSTALAMRFPCAAPFVVLLHDLGLGHMLEAASVMVCTALTAERLSNGGLAT